MGRCASVIELGSSTALEHLVKTGRCGFTAIREANVSLGHLTGRAWEAHSRPETSKSKTPLSYAALRKRAGRLHYGDETLPTSLEGAGRQFGVRPPPICSAVPILTRSRQRFFRTWDVRTGRVCHDEQRSLGI
jgi:hypothetical protein